MKKNKGHLVKPSEKTMQSCHSFRGFNCLRAGFGYRKKNRFIHSACSEILTPREMDYMFHFIYHAYLNRNENAKQQNLDNRV